MPLRQPATMATGTRSLWLNEAHPVRHFPRPLRHTPTPTLTLALAL